MRRQDQASSSPLGYGDLESRVAAKHLLRLFGGVAPRVVKNTYDNEPCDPFGRGRGITL
jgi:hypothetical protein